MPAIDFSEVQGLDPIPDGTYDAEIVFADEGESQSGHPKIDLRWKVLAGEHEGRQVFDTMSFHPKALWRTKDTLMALDFPEDFSGDITGEELLGRVATITVKIEPSSGTNPDTGEPYPERNRITKVKAADMSVQDLLS
jgi:hypothetical protein